MAHDPHEQETREVRTLPDDDALTPKRGTPSARGARPTLGLSRKHWNGARFVLLVLLLTAVALIAFLAVKHLM